MKKYRVNCLIAETTRIISGKIHTQVVKPNGSTFFMDDLFLFALKHFNEPDIKEKIEEKFRIRGLMVDNLLRFLLDAEFVVSTTPNDEGTKRKQ